MFMVSKIGLPTKLYRATKSALVLSLAHLRSSGKPWETLAIRAEKVFIPLRDELARKFSANNSESRIFDNKYFAVPIYEGTLSTVFAAKPLKEGYLVIIKTGNELFEHLIELETEALKKLASPNTVKLLGAREGENPYIVLEFIPGCTLSDLIKTKDLTRAEANYLIDAMLRIAHNLHAAGITHNDFNPNNFMIDLNGDVKVVDFGICSIKFESEDKRNQKIQVDLLMLAGIINKILEQLPSHPAKALVREVVNGAITARTPFASALDFLTAINRMSSIFPPAIRG
ncbi:hypothetical protein A3K48_06640 [candidate division WOR-1 bacterium RIFOXYA12_FULL_52_29]|uniref:Protein kinase domain-containing protein n=1 Tax=candidate division WOR-1 bacterium RIFOXYC12_FULL_54_18 TaxID=1802584 RepID=A0A1F4T7B8_UNCSA|nr:MAG: hypothetical protein A3K44_06640 [candidate division WOR-1 bacterium RIFOXYA2_FULL_51_19]OGC18198.1 MAG: hypothetical protein A3K48_06640 [candidate division WOR-1 bacterium RIFOXYA12_FULL_52_29]OGC27053.1 MAG: hypothetical protein A3K32_06635 [candidate division WOR-1 bacterium RIFOXYB2_FULL_45_9]OGC28615.1 MAG: hypothetical protein A3K49_06640 [candidate division WOR-1 bacterium RIFOXYC12_FULL_54_18]